MGVDYYICTDLCIYYKNNNTFLDYIELKREGRYFNYDSDNDEEYTLKDTECITIYKNEKWLIKNTRKIEEYKELLIKNNIIIENVDEIVKEISEEERD